MLLAKSCTASYMESEPSRFYRMAVSSVAMIAQMAANEKLGGEFDGEISRESGN